MRMQRRPWRHSTARCSFSFLLSESTSIGKLAAARATPPLPPPRSLQWPPTKFPPRAVEACFAAAAWLPSLAARARA